MKKLFFFALILLLFIPFLQNANAVRFDMNQLRPVINANDIVGVGKSIIFDASSTFLIDNNEKVEFEWDFGDNTQIINGEEVVHSYDEIGNYHVVLNVKQGNKIESISRDVFVYNKLILFITDVTEKQEGIEKMRLESQKDGTYIHLIESYNSATAFMSEEALSKKLLDAVSVIKDANYIAIWTRRGSGINTLTRLARNDGELSESSLTDAIKNKTIIVFSDEKLKTLGRIIQSSFNIINPKQIIITRIHKLENLFEAESAEVFLSDLEKSISEYKVINEQTGTVSIFNSMSYLVNFMITNGIPSNTILLLLMLPVIATIITFLKQVVGITTFGLYLPSIITLSFLALGLKFGLTILIIIIITGAILRKALDRFRLLNTPRIAIILTISTMIILLVLAFGTYIGNSSIATIAVFPMLIMTTMAEKFVSALSGKGFYSAVFLMAETTIVSLICYWVVELQYLQNLILGHPEIIFLLLIVNYGLGRWSGLRLTEHFRFREVMKHAEE